MTIDVRRSRDILGPPRGRRSCDVTFSIRHKDRMAQPNSAVSRPEFFHILHICALSATLFACLTRYRFRFLFFVNFRDREL